jgi:hypothetical protein
MAFSQATMEGDPQISRAGFDLLVSWASSSPAGTTFQVYLNRRLAWAGTARKARLPFPRSGDHVYIDVGTVAAGEAGVDFSASLPPVPADRALLRWYGGLWEAEDLVGFRIYRGATPGAAADTSAPVATVPYQDARETLGGWGQGGWGSGGWGQAGSLYSWTSGHLSSGTWHFEIVPYDEAGNANFAAVDLAVTITLPPSSRHPTPTAPG